MKLISENPKASISIGINLILQAVIFALRYYGVLEIPLELQAMIFAIIGWFTAYWSRINKTDAKVIAVTSDKQKEAIIDNAEKLQ